MTDKVEVLYFPKLCPHCQCWMRTVEKMSASWLECINGECSYIKEQCIEAAVDGTLTSDMSFVPQPYTCGRMRR